MQRELVERFMFLIHRIYYRSGLTNQVDFVIGYPCSIDFKKTYPTKYLLQDIRDQVINYVDRRYFLSLNDHEVRERMLDCLDNRFANLLLRTEIDGATAYVLLIALGACCGGRFEPDIYKLCVETLVQCIQNTTINNEWTETKNGSLIATCSCLLPSTRKASEFQNSIKQLFASLNDYSVVTSAEIILSTITHLL